MASQPHVPPDSYRLGYGEAFHRTHSGRNAATFAWFFTPHLKPGMRLLDCGCGPGSITLRMILLQANLVIGMLVLVVSIAMRYV